MKKLLFQNGLAFSTTQATITTDGEENIVAEEVTELRPGYVYYLHHDGRAPRHQIVKAGEGGVIKNMLGGQRVSSLNDCVYFEFPHCRLETNASLLNMVRDHWPAWATLIKGQMRNLGISFPPSTSNTVFSAGELENWILNQELILSPLAREFIKAVDTGVIDRITVLGQKEASRPVQVRMELTESGYTRTTNYYTWTGSVDVPESVINDGEEEIKDYITDWVNDNVSSHDCDFEDDQMGDFYCEDTNIKITDYGDISSLLEENDDDDYCGAEAE